MRNACNLIRAGFLVILIVGCGPLTVPPAPGPDHPAPGPKKPGIETVWTCLADDVEAGAIPDTDILILIIDRLKARNRVSDVEKGRFYDRFPGIRETRRPIDPQADAATLRGI